MREKLIDTNSTISDGGRAKLYWEGKKPNKFKEVQTTAKEVDLQQILQDFKLKGFEFGNWLSNEDRYKFIIATQKSLLDLALIFGTKNVGMDYSLGIAFGARGLQRAAAHYESVGNMINLTKMNGKGSLAHEYGHAIDYVFGRFIDQNKNYNALSGGHSVASTLDDNQGCQFRFLVNSIVDTIKTSQSYERIKKHSEYWHRRTEIFARSFEQYISFVLISRSIVNKFVAKDLDYYYKHAPYLTREDFKKVLPLFNELAKELSLFLRNKGKLVPTIKKLEPKTTETKKIAAEKKVLAKNTKAAPKATKKGKNSRKKMTTSNYLFKYII